MLTKVPIPLPSEVLLSAVDGVGEVLQQTPLSVTSKVPFPDVITPPHVAVV